MSTLNEDVVMAGKSILFSFIQHVSQLLISCPWSSLDLLVSDTWLDTGIGYWYRYPMTRYYERLLDTRSS